MLSDRGIKVVLLGDAGIGAKTSLLHRFVKGEFPEQTEPTVGVKFLTRRMDVDGAIVELEIWGLCQGT